MDGSVISQPAPIDPRADLDACRRLFTEARDLTQTARDMAMKARRYYDGKIDDRLARQLRAKKQPDFNINRVRPGVEGMVGVVDKGKSDPRCYPRTPKDEDSSEVATDSLRYVTEQNRWHQTKLGSFRNMLIEGVAAVLTEVDDQLEVKTRRIRFEEFFYDPYSRELDYSDASYMGVGKWQYVDALAAAYPEQETELRESCSGSGLGTAGDSTWEDRPNDGAMLWVDPKRKRLLTVEMYRLTGGTWRKTVFTGDLTLESGVSPYNDNDDKPCNPIEAVAAYADDQNARYGVVLDMMGPQDEINVYRRKAAHLATFRQFQETDPNVAAASDPEEVRKEGAKADGVIPPGYGVVANDKFAMDMELLQEAKSEIERIGPNPAVLGRDGMNASGRANLVRQQAGLTELAHLFSRLEDFELRVFRQIWARIRQFWTEPKFIRVTDEEQAYRFIQINEPVFGAPAPVIDPTTGMPQFDPVTRQIVMQPQFTGMKNAIAQMEVDIIVDTTPDTANVQQEQFQAILDLAKVYGPQYVPFEELVMFSSLPKKRQFTEALKAKAQQPNPQQEEAQQIAAAAEKAKIGKTVADTQKAHADAIKTMSEVAQPQNQPDYFGPQ